MDIIVNATGSVNNKEIERDVIKGCKKLISIVLNGDKVVINCDMEVYHGLAVGSFKTFSLPQ